MDIHLMVEVHHIAFFDQFSLANTNICDGHPSYSLFDHHMVGTHHTTSMLLKIEKTPYDGHSSHPLYWQTLPNLLYGGNLSYDEKASYGGDASYDGGAS